MAFHFLRVAGRARLFHATPLAAVFAVGALSACVAPAAEPLANSVDVRVLVKLVQPSGDTAAIAARVSAEAGVPAEYAASVSAVWHALVLHCRDAAACDAAVARLTHAAGVYEAVERDGRKQRL